MDQLVKLNHTVSEEVLASKFWMKISVRYQGNTKDFELPEDAFVTDLMNLVEEEMGLPAVNQKLIFSGKNLSDSSASLTSYRIKNGSKILVVGSTEKAQVSQDVLPPSISAAPFLDFSIRSPRILRDEYLCAQPHSTVIKLGPPQGAMDGCNFQLESLPSEPFIVRDDVGDSATLSFRSDDLVVDSETNHHRLFYQEILSFGIQAVPGYEQKYLAVGFHIKGKKLWVYFVPKQYRGVIELILQQRRA